MASGRSWKPATHGRDLKTGVRDDSIIITGNIGGTGGGTSTTNNVVNGVNGSSSGATSPGDGVIVKGINFLVRDNHAPKPRNKDSSVVEKLGLFLVHVLGVGVWHATPRECGRGKYEDGKESADETKGYSGH